MKTRIWALLFALVLVLSLAACGETPSEGDSQPQISQGEDSEDKTNHPEAPTAEGVGDLDNFHVEVKGASLAKNYEGAQVIVITYAWTNNSEDTTSASISMYEKAFQDGVQLENAYLYGDPNFDFEAADKDIRPGTTLDIQRAFVLTSETSLVEIELSEAFSWSDEKITITFDPAELT